MITFRTRPSGEDEWTQVQFSGDHEEELALAFAKFIQQTDWEVLVAQNEEDFSELSDWWNW